MKKHFFLLFCLSPIFTSSLLASVYSEGLSPLEEALTSIQTLTKDSSHEEIDRMVQEIDISAITLALHRSDIDTFMLFYNSLSGTLNSLPKNRTLDTLLHSLLVIIPIARIADS